MLCHGHTTYLSVLFIDLKSAKATADRKSASKPIGFEGDLRGPSSDLPERLHSQEVDLGPSQGDCLMAGNDSEEALTALMSRKTAISLFEGKALGLDKAILHSIDCCCKHVGEAGRSQLSERVQAGLWLRRGQARSHRSKRAYLALALSGVGLAPGPVGGNHNKPNYHTNVKLQL